jgi:hypothetical protein
MSGSQELSNIKNLMRGVDKAAKPFGFKVKNENIKYRKGKKEKPGQEDKGQSSEDKVTGHGKDREVYDAEVVDEGNRSKGSLPHTEEIWDAQEVRGRIGGFRKGLEATGPKAIEAPNAPMTQGPRGGMYVAQPMVDLNEGSSTFGTTIHSITNVPRNPNAGRQWGDGA